jgi:hypothetical protein
VLFAIVALLAVGFAAKTWRTAHQPAQTSPQKNF